MAYRQLVDAVLLLHLKTGGFVDHYLLPVIYPVDLTRKWQIALDLGVATLNLAVYVRGWCKQRK